MAGALRRVDANGIVGDVVECGVWKGGNIILARQLSPNRVCWLYDTFTGMTFPEDVDIKRSGERASAQYEKKKERGGKWHGVSVKEVRANLEAMGVFDERKTRFVVGPVEETLLFEINLPAEIALLRLDTDWHSSTKVELEVLYPRLAVGGVLIVDDYGHWMGARKAVNDYFGADAVWEEIDYTAVMRVKH